MLEEAEMGDVVAQCLVAARYYEGIEVPKDIIEAEKWWRRAAEKDNAAAQYLLGFCCYSNMTADEALYWIRKAADKGEHNAQMFLGVAYLWGGRLVRRDRVTALKWLILGSECRQSSSWQPKLFCWLVKIFTGSSQITQARVLAEEWKILFSRSHLGDRSDMSSSFVPLAKR